MKIRMIIPGAIVALMLSIFFLKSLDDPEKESMEDSSSKLALQGSTRREELKIGSITSGKVKSRNAEPDYHKRLILSDLTLEKIVKIKESLEQRPSFQITKAQKEVVPIKTGTEALDFLLKKYSMAFIPERYYEDNDMFYFSGGTLPEPVYDFSTGIVVDKRKRSIAGWDIR